MLTVVLKLGLSLNVSALKEFSYKTHKLSSRIIIMVLCISNALKYVYFG